MIYYPDCIIHLWLILLIFELVPSLRAKFPASLKIQNKYFCVNTNNTGGFYFNKDEQVAIIIFQKYCTLR